MNNILEYLKWRGDIKIDTLSEADSLILARLSYIPFERFLDKGEMLTIERAYYKAIDKGLRYTDFLQKEDYALLKMLSEAPRFKDLVLKDFVYDISFSTEKQFAAITIEINKKLIYVSYRGTDNTLVGWKEDFNLSFQSHVPAQKEALKYLNKIKLGFFKKVIIGGHSKGGNLAVYAAMNTSDKIKKRIIYIYNYDGPGFLENTISSEAYISIKEKIKTILPECSIVGRFLNYNDEYLVVDNTETLIMQHDIYSWKIEINDFVYLSELDDDSKKMEKIVTDWLAGLTLEERKKSLDIIFNLIKETEFNTLEDVANNWFAGAKTIFKTYKSIPVRDKKMLDKMGDLLYQSVKNNLFGKK